MTKDDIIKLARDAGFNWPEIHTTTIEERLERFANLVAAAEREECAMVCEGMAYVNPQPHHYAAAIRERGNT